MYASKISNPRQAVLEIIHKAGHIRQNGKQASDRTIAMTREVALMFLGELHFLGFKVENINNVGQKHISAVINRWYHTKHLSPKTILNYASRLRAFFRMAGKPGLVKRFQAYLTDVPEKDLEVSGVAKGSKSLASANIDLTAALAKVDAHDIRLGMMFRLQLAFGLRRAEAIKCRPWVQDKGSYFEILPGQAKGGRTRAIPIETAFQREMLDYVKAHCGKSEYLGWQTNHDGGKSTLKQSINRYKNAMHRLGFNKKVLGVTGHGLRAQYAENISILNGVLPATLQGTKNQVGRDEMKMQKLILSEAMGHGRARATTAYNGAFPKIDRAAPVDTIPTNVQKALAILPKELPAPDESLLHDCQAIADALADHRLDLTPPEIHLLWQQWSNRCGAAWVKPEKNIAKAVEAAAIDLLTAQKAGQAE